MDVAVWLRSLGLEQYEGAFRDNAVDATVPPKLTAEDLKDLGVTAVGHRRMFLDAIARLRSPASEEQRSFAAPLAGPGTAPPATDTAAERRQVTVMFSDLVGLAALSSGMDPEDFGEIIAACHKCVAEPSSIASRAKSSFVRPSAMPSVPTSISIALLLLRANSKPDHGNCAPP
jgi:hypothetical protein